MHRGDAKQKRGHAIVKYQKARLLAQWGSVQLSFVGKSNDLLFDVSVAFLLCCLCYIFHKQRTWGIRF